MNRAFTALSLQSLVAAAVIVAAPLANAAGTPADLAADHVHAASPTFVSTASREQVRAEAVALAARQPARAHEVGPIPAPSDSQLSRAQVRAEAVEAVRLGLTQGGETQREVTADQLAQIQRAGQRAAGTGYVAAVR